MRGYLTYKRWENPTMSEPKSSVISTNDRDVTRARLRDISLRYDPDKPYGIPAALDTLWEELADEADRVSDWASEGDSIAGSVISHIADRAVDAHATWCREKWTAAVNAFVEDLPEHCPDCAGLFAALDTSGIEYEVVELCNWCGKLPADTDPEMDGCCDEDCRYHLARDEGFVTDAEHAANLLEGWVPA